MANIKYKWVTTAAMEKHGNYGLRTPSSKAQVTAPRKPSEPSLLVVAKDKEKFKKVTGGNDS